MTNNTFVSYSRKDTEFTRQIVDAIKAKGLNAWVDWEGIPPTVDWMEQINKGIAEADTFLFLLSPDSSASKVCGDELEYASKNGKRIIPIVVRDVKPEDAPVQTRHLNWIFFRKDKENFDEAIDKLITAINTDYVWVQAHRRLQVKALEWEKHNKESGYLLRGLDLQDAEAQHALNSSKEPIPTDLQRGYVFASRKAVDRQRRILTITSIVVAIALLGLGIFASFKAVEATRQAGIAKANAEEALAQKAEAEKQRTEAENQRNEAETQRQLAVEKATLAQAGELSARSIVSRDDNFQLSMLLGIEANNLVDNADTRGTLLDNAQAHPQLLQYFNSDSGAIYSTVYSPDGKIFASGNENGDIILWDAATHEPIGQPLNGDTKAVTDIAFSPDGKILAAGSFDGSIILWDAVSGQKISQLIEKYAIYDYLTYVAFSPDGKTLATGRSDEKIIKRWDLATGKTIGEPLAVDSGVNDLVFSPDGRLLAAGDGDNVRLFDATTGQSLQSLNGNVYAVGNIAFNSDGTILAAGSYDHTIVLWDPATGQKITEWSTGQSSSVEDAITDLAFSPDGKIVASSNNAGNLFLWDVTTQTLIGTPLGGASAGEVLSIVFNPDGKAITSANRAGNIIVWDVIPRLSSARRLTGHTEAVTTVAFSQDGTMLASGSYDHNIILWDVSTGQPLAEPLTGHTDRVTDLTFSPDGKLLASAGCGEMQSFNCIEGEILFWDIASLQLVGEPWAAHTNYVSSIAYSPDGKILASAGYDQNVILWDVATGEPIGQPLAEHKNPIIGIAFSKDGKTLASWDTQGTIILWDVAAGKPVGDVLSGFGVNFSPDGKMFAGSRKNVYIVFWNTDTHEEINQLLVGLNNALGQVLFSPNGKFVASNNAFNPMLWDVETGTPMGQSFIGHSSYVTDFAFSPDGKLLVSGGYDKSIILWNLEQQVWKENACERAGRNLSQTEWASYFGIEPYRATCPQWPAGQ